MLDNLKQAYLPPTLWPHIEVDEERCDGCGRCVRTCPMQILEIKEKHVVSNQRFDAFRCVACDSCVAVCPKDAIRIEGVYRVLSGRYKNTDIFPQDELSEPRPFGEETPARFEDYENRLNETEKVIYQRRSVRLFESKQVPKEMISRILEAGRFAPSTGNNQPWKFTVIQDGEVIEEICEKVESIARPLANLAFPRSVEEFRKRPLVQKVFATLFSYARPGEGDQRVAVGVKAYTDNPQHHVFFHAPTVILVLCDKRGIGSVDLDTALCVENIILAAHSLGLGTCLIGVLNIPLRCYPKFSAGLGIVPPFKLLTAIALGYPKGTCDRAVRREPARVNWIG